MIKLIIISTIQGLIIYVMINEKDKAITDYSARMKADRYQRTFMHNSFICESFSIK